MSLNRANSPKEWQICVRASPGECAQQGQLPISALLPRHSRLCCSPSRCIKRAQASKAKRFHATEEAATLIGDIYSAQQNSSASPKSKPSSTKASAPKPASPKPNAPPSPKPTSYSPSANRAKPDKKAKQAQKEPSKRPQQHPHERPKPEYSAKDAALVRRVLRSKDYYSILEIKREASKTEILKGFRKLAVRLHPDKNRHPKAEEAFKRINTIKGVLTDPTTRRRYDRYGEAAVSHNDAAGPAGGQRPFTEEDLFNMFFGGVPGQRRRRRPRADPRHARGGQPRQRARQQQQGNDAMQMLQFLPILLLLAFSLFSGQRTDDVPFSLGKDAAHPLRRFTRTGVPYYVDTYFLHRYAKNPRTLFTVEQLVESKNFERVQTRCAQQKQARTKAIKKAKGAPIADPIAFAKGLKSAYATKTSDCDRLERLIDARVAG